MSTVELILAAPWVVRIVAGLLAFFIVLFTALFLLPGLVAWYRYDNVALRLRAYKKAQRGSPSAVFAGDSRLAHIWAEYEKTLHEQRQLDPATGQLEFVAWRATMPSGMIFTQEALVDSRIRTEFFKHLPGLCTGIGIIGTFAGLIDGLQTFHVSDDPAVVRNSLELLLHGVFQAFLVSAAAIALAMAVTFVEKFLLTTLYRKVEQITFEIDSSFEAGVGEEYLQRLVKATEESPDRSLALKDALVQELTLAWSGIADRQVRAQAAGYQELAQQLAQALRAELVGPLWSIAGSLEEAKRGLGLGLDASGSGGAQAASDWMARADTIAQRVIDAFAGLGTQLQSAVADIGNLGQRVAGTLRGPGEQAAAPLIVAHGPVAVLGDDTLARIEAATQALGRAARDVEDYLDGIGAVLLKSQEAFARGIQTTVDGVYGDFYTRLSSATQLLGDAVQELASAIDYPDRRA